MSVTMATWSLSRRHRPGYPLAAGPLGVVFHPVHHPHSVVWERDRRFMSASSAVGAVSGAIRTAHRLPNRRIVSGRRALGLRRRFVRRQSRRS